MLGGWEMIGSSIKNERDLNRRRGSLSSNKGATPRRKGIASNTGGGGMSPVQLGKMKIGMKKILSAAERKRSKSQQDTVRSWMRNAVSGIHYRNSMSRWCLCTMLCANQERVNTVAAHTVRSWHVNTTRGMRQARADHRYESLLTSTGASMRRHQEGMDEFERLKFTFEDEIETLQIKLAASLHSHQASRLRGIYAVIHALRLSMQVSVRCIYHWAAKATAASDTNSSVVLRRMWHQRAEKDFGTQLLLRLSNNRMRKNMQVTVGRAVQTWASKCEVSVLRTSAEFAARAMQGDHQKQRDAQAEASARHMKSLKEECGVVVALKTEERRMLEDELDYTRDLLQNLTTELEETLSTHEAQDAETNVMYRKAMDKNKDARNQLAEEKDQYCAMKVKELTQQQEKEMADFKDEHRSQMLAVKETHAEEVTALKEKLVAATEEVTAAKHAVADERQEKSVEVTAMKERLSEMKLKQVEKLADLDRAHTTVKASQQIREASYTADKESALSDLRLKHNEELTVLKNEIHNVTSDFETVRNDSERTECAENTGAATST